MQSSPNQNGTSPNREAIAIVGMGCLFPKSHDRQSFWRVLRSGQDCISEIPDTHWSANDYYDGDHSSPDRTYAKVGGFLEPYNFDPTEFSLPPTSLEATDTSQLLGLVGAKLALEDAGYGPKGKEVPRESTSVILGVTGTLELVIPLGARLGFPHWRRALNDAGIDPETREKIITQISSSYVPWQENSFPGLLGNVVAGRIANKLDLHGTNCVVDAACASSLAAVHLALAELESGRADLVLTGGVDTLNDIFMYMCFSKTPALSSSGAIRPFADDSDGTLLGEGVGIVALKRLADAERDQDKIYAVIRGLGSSSDGGGSAIYAPSSAGQRRALDRAYALTGIAPDTIDMVEAHGTGTKVGDQVEFEALNAVYTEAHVATAHTALGTVKSQIGHTKASAGAASLCKVALALYNKVLLPTINVSKPNSKYNIEQSPFYLNKQAKPWLAPVGHKRRAALSSFGFGGSNFHVILEEHESKRNHPAWDGSQQILAFSATTKEELATKITAAAKNEADRLTWVAFRSRQEFQATAPWRATAVATPDKLAATLNELAASLASDAKLPAGCFLGTPEDKAEGIAFLFPGQGSQYVNMLSEFSTIFPEPLENLQLAEECLPVEQRPYAKIYPPTTFDSDTVQNQAAALTDTRVAQPSLGVMDQSVARILQRFGVKPQATAGHSYGELVALNCAGCISDRELLELSALRGRLMAAGDGGRGAMMAIAAPIAEIVKLVEELGPDIVLANHNHPKQGVISGTKEAIAKAKAVCQERRWTARLLQVSAAFHSPLMEAAHAPFLEALNKLNFKVDNLGNTSNLAVYSNYSGNVYPQDLVAAKQLLADQLVNPVRFIDIVENMYASGIRTFIEVGPKAILGGLVHNIMGTRPHHILSTDGRKGGRELETLAHTLAQLAALGVAVRLDEWEEAVAEPRHRNMTVKICGANYRSPSSRPTTPWPDPHTPVDGYKSMNPAPVSSNTTKINATSPATVSTTKINEASPATVSATKIGEASLAMASNTATKMVTSLPAKGSDGPAFPAPAKVATPHSANQSTVSTPSSASAAPAPARQLADEHPTSNKTREIMATPSKSENSHQVPNGYVPGPASNTAVSEAFRTIQEGLIAMQSLQQQTAAAHNQFLRGQQETQQAFQSLISNQQNLTQHVLTGVAPIEFPPIATPMARIAEPNYNFPPMAAPAAAPIAAQAAPAVATVASTVATVAPAVATVAPAVTRVAPAVATVAPSVTTVAPAVATVAPAVATVAPAVNAAMANTPSSAPSAAEVNKGIIAIVSEKTGYPTEMLNLDMDLESDLGIDSIKRVEILAAIEEKLPGTNAISPDEIGTLHTLRQVAERLTPDVATSPAGETSVAPAGDVAGVAPADIAGAVLAIVSEKTGYPVEMLNLEMDLESDLGIDSIKRVEILAAIEEKLPGTNSITPDEIGSLHTLGRVVERLGEGQATTAAPTSATASSADIAQQVLAIVAEKTGYPVEMLNLDMDLESDLGIDSIKRVEILAAIEEKLPGVNSITPDEIGALHTLRRVVERLSGGSPNDTPDGPQGPGGQPRPQAGAGAEAVASASAATSSVAGSPGGEPRAQAAGPLPECVQRRVLKFCATEAPNHTGLPVCAGPYLLSDDGYAAPFLRDLLEKHGCEARVAPLAELAVADSPWHQTPCGTLVLLCPRCASEGESCSENTSTRVESWSERDEALLKTVFQAVKASLCQLASQPSCLTIVTRLDGQFGTSGRDYNPVVAGVHGLNKVVPQELTNVTCKSIDVDPGLSASDVAQAILGELGRTGNVEVGLVAGSRMLPVLEDVALAARPAREFPRDGVVVVTGGARGVTATCAKALARQLHPSLVLLGRSPAPTEESEDTRRAQNAAELKRVLFARASQAGKLLIPAVLEKECRQILANREISQTLSDIAQCGCRVAYRQVDVRDQDEVAATLSSIRAELGPIRGLIHGAGVLADRRIVDKTPEQFNAVFDTKIVGLRSLLSALRDDDLAFMVFFSSVTARFGRPGQSDYAMANEVMNKVAHLESTRRPQTHVVAMGWGPWDGGMVDDSLRRTFAAIGAELVDRDRGAQTLVEEIVKGQAQECEVILGSGFSLPEVPRSVRCVISRSLTLEENHVLAAHVLDHQAVLPMALMLEWMSEAALVSHPKYDFAGMDDLQVHGRLLAPKSPADTADLQIEVGSAWATPTGLTVETQISLNGRVYATARAILSRPQPAKKDSDTANLPEFAGERLEENGFPCSLGEAYREYLFHGPELQGISKIKGCSEAGMIANAKRAPKPEKWLHTPNKKWLADPLLLDCALQLGLLWTGARRNTPSLPVSGGQYRQYVAEFPSSAKLMLYPSEASERRLRGDVYIVGKHGLLASWKDVEWALSPTLRRAFKANSLG